MDGTTERRSLPGPEYVTRVTFHAPIRFCFRWCTDYRASDPQLEGGGYARRILERHRDRVVYEDLAKLPNGWS
ncbi:MAG TPA: hypothetical protein VMH90_00550, partial [Thermoplasmata archaeon]|nr:hypothetical protein [Thermoplasmata archaeon]